jgi:deazaflavin-dependent oxidoreductase (nitroreductase family)
MATSDNAAHQDFIPPAERWVRSQLDVIDEAGGDTTVAQIQGRPIVVVTMRGAKSGRPRRVPLMRVEHDGCYLAVASKGGTPKDPMWVANLRTYPDDVVVRDGMTDIPVSSRELAGAERDLWWQRGVAAFPSYADYQRKTTRTIPIFLLEPR